MTDLEQIPEIGRRMKDVLIQMDYPNVESLKNQNPELMYEQYCGILKVVVDRCVLYTFRCAVYYASNESHDEELLK